MITETGSVSKEREIPRQIEIFKKGQELLRQKVLTLQDQLSPVLKIGPPKMEAKRPDTCRQTEFGKSLDDANDGLQGSIEIIGEILDRLEI